MKLHRLLGGTIGIVLIATTSAHAQATASDEVMLRVVQQEFDEDAAGRVLKTHAEALAKQFKVDPQIVENLRASKQGWGEIAVRMGMAQELAKMDSKHYQTIGAALVPVGERRAMGKNWGEIAKELGFTLSPVVNDMQRVRKDLKAEAKLATTGGGKPDRVQPAEQAQRSNRSDRSSRLDRSDSGRDR